METTAAGKHVERGTPKRECLQHSGTPPAVAFPLLFRDHSMDTREDPKSEGTITLPEEEIMSNVELFLYRGPTVFFCPSY